MVLGSTGSIGTQALDVCRWRGYRLAGLVAGKNLDLIRKQIAEFRPLAVSVDVSIASLIEREFPLVKLLPAEEVAGLPADVVVAAIPGFAGLEGVRTAARLGRRIALANKESMVAAGHLLWEEANKGGAEIIPVDSEHSALFQCLVGEKMEDVAELILTASGGPFLKEPASLSQVTPQEALRHPRWKMGPKVTVDSSTLFNKGLEVLEARELFRLDISQVKVLIHPQSYLHSMVRFNDGNIKAQLGPTDMRLPIQYALAYPERPPTPLAKESLPLSLEFFPPDTTRFPALELAYQAGRMGGLAPTVLNAADEVAVESFLRGGLGFLGIAEVLERVLADTPQLALTWDNVYHADAWARERAREVLETVKR